MQFGRTEEALAGIDFTLPRDSAGTAETLASANREGNFRVYVGAPKWGDKSWIGKIYPPKTPDKDMLAIYSKNFNTVEFGPSFYTIYSADQLSKWTAQVTGSPDFKFCPRFPQAITHIRRLTNAEIQTTHFYAGLSAFEGHLGPLMLQLGENFSTKSFPQLKTYLTTLPKEFPVAVEVRHKNWFGDPESRKALFDLLRERQISTIISDTPGRRDTVHMELTTTQALIRFVGNNLAPSDFNRIDAWVDRLKDWKDQGLKTVWFFMHQDDEKFVPDACNYLIERLNRQLGTDIAGPKLLDNDQ